MVGHITSVMLTMTRVCNEASYFPKMLAMADAEIAWECENWPARFASRPSSPRKTKVKLSVVSVEPNPIDLVNDPVGLQPQRSAGTLQRNVAWVSNKVRILLDVQYQTTKAR